MQFFPPNRHSTKNWFPWQYYYCTYWLTTAEFIREENTFSGSTSTMRNRKIFLVHTFFPETTEHPYRHTALKCTSNWTLLTLDCNRTHFWAKIDQWKKNNQSSIKVHLVLPTLIGKTQPSKIQAFWKSEHYKTFILDTVQLTDPMFAIMINIKDRERFIVHM